MENKSVASKHYYLLDASAFCRFIEYISANARISHNIIQRAVFESYFYYMPQFCIAEVFNTFAKWHYAEKRINEKKYKELCSIFKFLIHDRLVIYPYDLHRYHNLNCDKVFPVEHTTPHSMPKKGKLSTFDILIIAMALELQLIHGNDNVSILSCDNRLTEISKLLKIKTEIYC
ncbi:MAG: PIN domain-containing protein [Endomicrobium sp.]|jgi:predicted nucleic acid-binding protein|nr:PIN domain-containing protein [Endomicrobium sp.]